MRRPFFITGSGTGVGKTFVAAALGNQLTGMGYSVDVRKPVISGFKETDTQSDSAVLLESTGKIPTREEVEAISPWRYRAPLSPHLAARAGGNAPTLVQVADFCKIEKYPATDFLLVEGAGGVMSPLNETHTFLDLVAELGYPAIVVCGSYLGGISHALTAFLALESRAVPVAAAVVCEAENSAGLADTADSIRQFTGERFPLYTVPRIQGEKPWIKSPRLLEICFPKT